MIKNYKKENISSCTYDFRLGELFRHRKTKLVSKDNRPKLKKLNLPYIIKPGEFILGKSIEQFDTPLELMSIYAIKSFAFRIGLNIICGTNDPGYKGEAVFGIQNISENNIKLEKGMSLIKTAFITLKGNAVPIQTKYMGGKVI